MAGIKNLKILRRKAPQNDSLFVIMSEAKNLILKNVSLIILILESNINEEIIKKTFHCNHNFCARLPSCNKRRNNYLRSYRQ